MEDIIVSAIEAVGDWLDIPPGRDCLGMIQESVSLGLGLPVEIDVNARGFLLTCEELGETELAMFDSAIKNHHREDCLSEFQEAVNKSFWSAVLRLETLKLERELNADLGLVRLFELDRYSHEWN